MSKIKKIGAGFITGATALSMTVTNAFASEPSPVVSAITGAGDSLKADAGTVIGSAIGIGVVFFGAKLLWGKFKSMAR